MDVLERYYGKQPFIMYGLFGAVPGTNASRRKIFLVLSSLTLSFCGIFQVLKLVKDQFTLESIIEVFPTTMVVISSIIYVLHVVFGTEERYSALLSMMTDDLEENRTEEEERIKRRFADGSRLLAKTYTSLFILSTCLLSLSCFLPRLLDVLMPLNESRELELLAVGEIFIDQRRYFYHLYLVETCCALLIGTVLGAGGGMSIIIIVHVRSIFAVISHQLENLTGMEEVRELSKGMSQGPTTLERLHKCIRKHQISLRFAILMRSFYDIPLVLVLSTTFCILTLSLVQITNPQMINLKTVIFTGVQLAQFFLLSYTGQNLIDTSIYVSESAYKAQWDVCPPDMRKLLQLMILRSSYSCEIVAKGLYTLSMENFMSVVQMATSYYMVIRNS